VALRLLSLKVVSSIHTTKTGAAMDEHRARTEKSGLSRLGCHEGAGRKLPLPTRGLAALLVLALAAGPVGCATKTRTGALVGGAAGAGVGGIVGALVGGTRGAAIGVGVGAVVGAGTGLLVGRYLDRRTGDRAAAARQVGSMPRDRDIVEVQKSEVEPLPVKAGQSVVLRVEYSVLAPNPDQRVELTEWRAIRKSGETVMGPVERDTRREQGVFTSAYQFQVPSNMAPGEYTVLTVLETGDGQKRAASEARLVVQ